MKAPRITYGEERNPTYVYARVDEIRDAFWEAHPQFASLRRARKRQNDYPVDVRVAWVDFKDGLTKAKQLSQGLADKVIL